MNKGTRVSKGTEVSKCEVSIQDQEARLPVGIEWEMKSEGAG